MIDAKDLRIGNWVNREYWNPHPTEPSIELDSCFIYSIQSDRVSVRISDKKVIARIPTEKLQPIPLTPEILEKCGFKQWEPNDWWGLQPTNESQTFALFKPENKPFHYVDGAFSPEIKYLHDLQNLYYALTKKELEYKP